MNRLPKEASAYFRSAVGTQGSPIESGGPIPIRGHMAPQSTPILRARRRRGVVGRACTCGTCTRGSAPPYTYGLEGEGEGGGSDDPRGPRAGRQSPVLQALQRSEAQCPKRRAVDAPGARGSGIRTEHKSDQRGRRSNNMNRVLRRQEGSKCLSSECGNYTAPRGTKILLSSSIGPVHSGEAKSRTSTGSVVGSPCTL